ncbi:MAG: type II toxin-antitoxin system HicA family toxin [Bacteroidales bacterium]|nr:type II toxin-antitoxin system HicA family toxin [Bacteroidales bacterium]
MKYAELERKLAKAGCYDLKLKGVPHPVWFSPITGKTFTTSHHKSQEVRRGTLKSIIEQSGIEL